MNLTEKSIKSGSRDKLKQLKSMADQLLNKLKHIYSLNSRVTQLLNV
jgi:hypothetical protein